MGDGEEEDEEGGRYVDCGFESRDNGGKVSVLKWNIDTVIDSNVNLVVSRI